MDLSPAGLRSGPCFAIAAQSSGSKLPRHKSSKAQKLKSSKAQKLKSSKARKLQKGAVYLG
jgi:hypothetical protein